MELTNRYTKKHMGELTRKRLASVEPLFETYLENEGYSKNTVDTYMNYLKYFVIYLFPPTKKEVENVCNIFNRSDVILAAVKKWLAFYSKDTEDESYEKIPVPKKRGKTKRKVPKNIPTPDLQKIFESDKLNLFRKVFVMILAESGMRISELLEVKVKDLHFEGDDIEIFVRESKTAQRFVYVTPKTKKLIIKYLTQRENVKRFEDLLSEVYLLPFRTRQRAWQILTKLSEDVLGTKISAHKYRHTCGSTLRNKDVPIDVIAEILGHVDLNVTSMYSSYNRSKVKQHYNKAFDVEVNEDEQQ